jgi:hypothetical protein
MPRITDHADPRGVRFTKKIDKEITAFCTIHEIRPSTLIQMAVECFLKNEQCFARKKVTRGIL